MRIDLNGQWEFFDTSEKVVRQANVPSCNYLDLINCGALADPFYGQREKDVKYIAEREWVYKRRFNFEQGKTHFDEILLVCEMLDTLCSLSLNKKEIGNANNCHVKHTFNISDTIKSGENELEIRFKSPVNFVKEKYKKCGAPPNNNGQNGIVHIRKPQCHFGWDWGPVLPPSGVSGNIYIECNSVAKITDLSVTQFHTNGKVTLDVLGEYSVFPNAEGKDGLGGYSVFSNAEGKADTKLAWSLEITSPDGEILSVQKGVLKDEIKVNTSEKQLLNTQDTVKKGEISASVEIINPQLWWTRELSQSDVQPLYVVLLRLEKNGEIVSEKKLKIGLRTIELNRSKDKFGNNFQFIINNVPIFAKGAAWIPADSFVNRFDEAKLDALLDAAQFSNMNMLRVWGGGYYESDMFYEKCDARGILVWQDFCFACQAYPFFDESFLASVMDEVSYNVKRLRHHASLALWCGNNEIETMSALWITMRRYVMWTKKFFYSILPQAVKKLDTQTPYVEGSPCGEGFMKGTNADGSGDTHLWAVWHGLQPLDYYRTRMTRFCSEFGFESLPQLKTIDCFAEKSDFSLNSPVMRSHQKCNSGNDKMAYYICSKYNLPKQFEDYIYLSQLAQHECVSDATEHWRRNKGRCNGALYWQFNDCWPVCSWASIDYYGRYKALQYTARHFFAPQSVSIENSKNKISVFAFNDLTAKLNATISVRVIDINNGKTHFSKTLPCAVEAGDVKELFEIKMKELKKICDLSSSVFVCDLTQNDVIINRKTCLFYAEKDVKLPCPKIEKNVIIKDNVAYITLSSNCFVRKVALSHSREDAHFSDNYFDILPNEKVVITQKIVDSTSAEAFTNYSTDAKIDVVQNALSSTYAEAITNDSTGAKIDVMQNALSSTYAEAFTNYSTDLEVGKTQQKLYEGSAERYSENLEIKNVTDIKDVEGKFTCFTTRAKVFLQPINFFSWLGYKFSAKPKK